MSMFRKATTAAVAALTLSAAFATSVETASARGYRSMHRHHAVRYVRKPVRVRYIVRYVVPTATIPRGEEIVAADVNGKEEFFMVPMVSGLAGLASFGMIGKHPFMASKGDVVAADRVAPVKGVPCKIQQKVYAAVDKRFLGYQTANMICS